MGTPIKVLMVEDSPDDAALVLDQLAQAGFTPTWKRVETERDYLAGLQEHPAIVFSDYSLPHFTTQRALELLQNSRLDIPFIVISGTIGEERAVESIKSGATDYLLKDRLGRLGPAVRRALQETRDRAERRRAEEQLLLQTAALNAAANSVMITDPHGSIIWVNPAFTALTGYNFKDVVGQTPRVLKSGKHDRAFYAHLWKTVLAGKTWRGELTNQRKDGSCYFAEQIITPVRSEAGAITHFIGIMNDVTERKKGEEELRLVHTQVQQLLEHSPAVLYALKLEGEKVVPYLVSENMTRLLGFSVAETLHYEWWLAHLHSDDQERAIASIGETLAKGVSRTEYRLGHKGGGYRWVDDNRRLVRDADGKPAQLVGVWMDTTDRKRAEEVLRESERRFREMLENVELIAMTLDIQGMVTFCNDYLLQLTGWKREEVIGNDWFSKFIPQSEPRVHEVFCRTIKIGALPAHFENPIQTRDGRIRQIVWNNTMLRDPAGNIIGTASIGEDVTERQQAAMALRETHQKLQHLLARSPAVIYSLKLGTKVAGLSSVSENVEKLTGFATEEALQPDWLAARVHPDDRAETSKWEAESFSREQSSREYRFKRKDGQRIWIRDERRLVQDAAGEPGEIIGSWTDITEKKNLEAQFLRSQRLEVIGQLASGVAHDLNNILTPILMSVPLLRRGMAPDDLEQTIDRIEQSTLRGAQVVKQLLTLGRGGEGQRGAVQPKHLIHEMAKIIKETFPKSIELEQKIAKDLWTLTADVTHLHQVLLNLCVNARDAMPKGGKLSIKAENAQLAPGASDNPDAKAGPYVLLQVADTGTGIPPDVLDKIFEPFFTTKEVGKGTGLGLATVQGIVRNHGGFIEVESVLNAGTVFTVYLPATPDVVAVKTEQPRSAKASGRGETILVVDDERPLRDTVRDVLVSAGYQVLTAADGIEAVAVFSQNQPQVKAVLCDLMMPGLDGLAVTRILKKIDPHMSILICSGLMEDSNQKDKIDEFEALGIKTFLSKPYNEEELLNALQAAVQQDQMAQGTLRF